MRTEKEIKEKIEELRNKAFDLIEKSQYGGFNKKVSIRQIRLIIDALEYVIGKKEDLDLLVDYKRKAKKGDTI